MTLIATSSEPIIHPSEADVEADGRVDVDAEENLRPLNEPSISLRQVERLLSLLVISDNQFRKLHCLLRRMKNRGISTKRWNQI
jgi:hypothetical protein